MRKCRGRFSVLLALSLLVALPAAALAYSVPPPSGGSHSTKKLAKAIGKKLENGTCKKDLGGIKVKAHENAGKLGAKVTHNGTKIAGGSLKFSSASSKTLKITFNSAGKSLLKSNQCSGATVQAKVTFKSASGKSSTSTEKNLKLG